MAIQLGKGFNLVVLINRGLHPIDLVKRLRQTKSVLADEELVFGRWAYKWERLDHKQGTYKI